MLFCVFPVSYTHLIDLFYLKFDNANVLKLLKDKEAEIDKRGNYSAAEDSLNMFSFLKELMTQWLFNKYIM